jgi:hypothetical protein
MRRADPPSKGFYRLGIGSRNWKSGQDKNERPYGHNNNNSIQLFIIDVPSQQPKGQFQTQHSLDQIITHYIQTKNYRQALVEEDNNNNNNKFH